jgi:hypothetical protein
MCITRHRYEKPGFIFRTGGDTVHLLLPQPGDLDRLRRESDRGGADSTQREVIVGLNEYLN